MIFLLFSHVPNFIEKGCISNKQFHYLSTFLDDVVPILMRRAIPLFFAFDRTNYSRCMSLYYHCIKLKENFQVLPK